MKEYIKSFVRHQLSAVSGALIALGLAPSVVGAAVEVNTEILTGLLLYGVSQGISFYRQYSRK